MSRATQQASNLDLAQRTAVGIRKAGPLKKVAPSKISHRGTVIPEFNFKKEIDEIVRFLEDFTISETSMELDGGEAPGKRKYKDHLESLATRKETYLTIELDDVAAWSPESGIGESLANSIVKNTKRYHELFYEAVDRLIPRVDPSKIVGGPDVIDVITSNRLYREEQARAQLENSMDGSSESKVQIPPTLLRRYELYFKPRSFWKALPVRQVKAEHVGHLLMVKGIVTRVHEVKPLVRVATYTCDRCGSEIYQAINERSFTPLEVCPSMICRENFAKGKLYMQTRGSKFVKYQEIRIQEMADQVPVGHTPRAMACHIYGELTRKVTAGDMIIASGILLPVPYTGFRALRAGLLADTYIEIHHIKHLKERYAALGNDLEALDRVRDFIESNRQAKKGSVYTILSRSIAPEIWGHEDVKKALLLMLAGANTKITNDGMKIRGDINICLMGDPGIAKSQLLKFVTKVAPRAVYTTGRGSSGVGLTAAVTKDSVTGDMVLEGGALVLADNGICAIDEFDKMQDGDKTAIHEVMEQQTVSISKAGINTTLNARTSILAAANPAYGRYNINRTASENINLPAALLSRFDILFLLLDIPDESDDHRLANHVLHVHSKLAAPPVSGETVSPQLLREYLAQAKRKQPTIPDSLSDFIVSEYVNLRQEAHQGIKEGLSYVSPRTLLAIIRLSLALARLRMSDFVERDDVNEAIRLMKSSKASLVLDTDISKGHLSDPKTAIYTLINHMATQEMDDSGQRAILNLDDIRRQVLAKGYKASDLDETIETYAKIDIWQVLSNRRLKFIN